MINKVKTVSKLVAGRMWIELAFYVVCDFIDYYFRRRKQVKEVYEEEEKPRRKRRARRKKTVKETE